jgi:hypothetical protein
MTSVPLDDSGSALPLLTALDVVSECEGKISATGDSMAVEGVWEELVSGGIPVMQGKYREILRNQTPLCESGPKFPSLSALIATDSL